MTGRVVDASFLLAEIVGKVKSMTKKNETILEATREWVGTFNAFPLNMITKLFNIDVYDWREITPVSEGCRAWSDENQKIGYVTEIKESEDGEKIAVIELDNGEKVEELKADLSREDDDYFPMWGTMWQFSDSCDDRWLENHLDEMANCGFRIYESDEFGYFFGIDGAGYDFYEAHWIPLYSKRGLLWHTVV